MKNTIRLILLVVLLAVAGKVLSPDFSLENNKETSVAVTNE